MSTLRAGGGCGGLNEGQASPLPCYTHLHTTTPFRPVYVPADDSGCRGRVEGKCSATRGGGGGQLASCTLQEAWSAFYFGRGLKAALCLRYWPGAMAGHCWQLPMSDGIPRCRGSMLGLQRED